MISIDRMGEEGRKGRPRPFKAIAAPPPIHAEECLCRLFKSQELVIQITHRCAGNNPKAVRVRVFSHASLTRTA